MYSCICGEETREIARATIMVVDGKIVVKEALCSCGKYMDSEPTEGMPNLIRTDPTLDRVKDRNRRDKIIKDNINNL